MLTPGGAETEQLRPGLRIMFSSSSFSPPVAVPWPEGSDPSWPLLSAPQLGLEGALQRAGEGTRRTGPMRKVSGYQSHGEGPGVSQRPGNSGKSHDVWGGRLLPPLGKQGGCPQLRGHRALTVPEKAQAYPYPSLSLGTFCRACIPLLLPQKLPRLESK